MRTIRVLQNPFSRSLSLHLLLLMLLAIYFVILPKQQSQNEQISVNVIESQNHKSQRVLSDKTRNVKESISAREIGSGNPSDSRKISVSDLGVKLDQKWSSHVMGEASKGGDMVEGLKQEETSAFNTEASLYFMYFQRIHGQLYHVWKSVESKAEEKYSNSAQQLPNQPYLITRALITLNTKGEILKVQILRKSGAVELDSAAVVALNQAGPYPNPPKGMLNKDGIAEFPLNFIVKN